MRSTLKPQCQTQQQPHPMTAPLTYHHRYQIGPRVQRVQYPQQNLVEEARKETFLQQLTRQAVDRQLNYFVFDRNMWQSRFFYFAIAMIVFLGIGLYLWYSQNKKISDISKKIEDSNRRAKRARRDNRETLSKIHASTILNSNFKKPPWFVGNVVYVAPGI